MDKLFGPEIDSHVFAYLDDIIVVTETFEEHLLWLGKVLQKLKDANLTMNPEKSKLCRSEVKYLGYVVGGTGLQTDPSKVSAIAQFPAPTNPRQVRRFIGMCSWYRAFVPDFATVAAPLSKLMCKNIPWTWGPEQQGAFGKIQERLMSTPVLSCPDFTRPFLLSTDASKVGLGAVLEQRNEKGKNTLSPSPVEYSMAPRKLTPFPNSNASPSSGLSRSSAAISKVEVLPYLPITAACVICKPFEILPAAWQDGR